MTFTVFHKKKYCFRDRKKLERGSASEPQKYLEPERVRSGELEEVYGTCISGRLQASLETMENPCNGSI